MSMVNTYDSGYFLINISIEVSQNNLTAQENLHYKAFECCVPHSYLSVKVPLKVLKNAADSTSSTLLHDYNFLLALVKRLDIKPCHNFFQALNIMQKICCSMTILIHFKSIETK